MVISPFRVILQSVIIYNGNAKANRRVVINIIMTHDRLWIWKKDTILYLLNHMVIFSGGNWSKDLQNGSGPTGCQLPIPVLPRVLGVRGSTTAVVDGQLRMSSLPVHEKINNGTTTMKYGCVFTMFTSIAVISWYHKYNRHTLWFIVIVVIVEDRAVWVCDADSL